jgi:L-threonylcarbamoyladenylate synthase
LVAALSLCGLPSRSHCGVARLFVLNTEILAANHPSAIERAAMLLAAGELVAIPTETVYGLAGNGRDDRAVATIFQVKERPFFDPLILHLPDKSWVERLSKLDPQREKLVAALIERFWPGPLTLLLPKSEQVSDLVTASLPTVALRMPANPVLQAILQKGGFPVAAPSANRFGRVSPTRAEHVLEELGSKIPLIIDDGPTKLGLESTIVEPKGSKKLLLHRPGPIGEADLAEFGPVETADLKGSIKAPGQTPSHYAPDKPLRLIEKGHVPADAAEAGLVAWGQDSQRSQFRVRFSLSESRDLVEAATRLFSLLRAMDREAVTAIYVEKVPETGIGRAIMNRLYRAAAETRGDVKREK